MALNTKHADAEILADKCRELEELARYSGFEFVAYLVSITHMEFVKWQRQATPAGRGTSVTHPMIYLSGERFIKGALRFR